MADQSLYYLTHTIYAFPGDMARARPWVGVVITSEGTVLVDSGNGPLQAAEIQDALYEMGAPPTGRSFAPFPPTRPSSSATS
jgi:hypothetical protein